MDGYDYSAPFFVLEGVDGSGKATQAKLLTERLRAAGYDIETFDFPRYDQPSSYFIKQYLNGRYGPASELSPYTASIFYAMDRFESAPAIRAALDKGRVVLSNRYVASNMAHQGSKISNAAQQRGFFIWDERLEHNLLGIPRPTLNIFLRVPVNLSFELVGRKKSRQYTSKSHDEHEADLEHLTGALNAFETLSRLFPRDFATIDCTRDGKLLGVLEISNLIWNTIKPLLPQPPPHKGKELVIDLESLGVAEKASPPPRKPSAKKTIDKKVKENRTSAKKIPSRQPKKSNRNNNEN